MANKNEGYIDTRTPEQKFRDQYQMTDTNLSADVLNRVHAQIRLKNIMML